MHKITTDILNIIKILIPIKNIYEEPVQEQPQLIIDYPYEEKSNIEKQIKIEFDI